MKKSRLQRIFSRFKLHPFRGKWLPILGLFLLITGGFFWNKEFSNAQAPHPKDPEITLRYLAEQRGFDIGSSIKERALRRDPLYGEVLAREFNILKAEHGMKFEPLHPERDRYDFEDADAMVAFAKAHNMKVRGHTLVWHLVLPRWLNEGHFNREEMKEILRDHIYTVVGRYRGQIATWDVLNEAIEGDGALKDTIWLQTIGPEYVDLAFQWAHEADPEARLVYNDYGLELKGQKADAIYRFVKDLVQRGVPITGVGLQMHVGLTGFPEPEELAANIQAIADLGLEVEVTEMDVPLIKLKGSRKERLKKQASIYRDMLKTCLEAPTCKSFLVWGVTDKYSWLTNFTGQVGDPLLFDKNYQAKPAYYALRDELKIQTQER